MNLPATASTPRSDGALWADALWGKSRNADCRCRALVVVGPYPTKGFFKKFLDKFSPKEVTVVVDEGWSDTEVMAVEKALQPTKATIRFAGRRRGIVHAKLYYVEWEVKRGGNVRRQLLWGSANASEGGFGLNAETLSSVALSAGTSETKTIEAYFDRLVSAQAGESIRQVLVRPTPEVQLVLPSFDMRKDLKDISFDAWVQKGVLCHPYQPDPGFGAFTVKLKKPLPPGALVKYVSKRGATSDAKHDSLRFPFVLLKPKGKGNRSRWKTQFFVESWLGFWTSAECAEAARVGKLTDSRGKPVRFVAPGSEERASALDAIRELKDEQAWLNEYLKKLRSLFRGLKKKGAKAGAYFRTVNGDLDEVHYRKKGQNQLQAQKRRARSRWFYERFKNGYEFLGVPPLRGIGSGSGDSFTDPFEEFVESLAQTLTVLASRTRKENLLMLKIAQVLGPGRPIADAISTSHKDLVRELRVRWKDYRERVRDFYRGSPPSI